MLMLLMLVAAIACLACSALAATAIWEDLNYSVSSDVENLTGMLISIGALAVPIAALYGIWSFFA